MGILVLRKPSLWQTLREALRSGKWERPMLGFAFDVDIKGGVHICEAPHLTPKTLSGEIARRTVFLVLRGLLKKIPKNPRAL